MACIVLWEGCEPSTMVPYLLLPCAHYLCFDLQPEGYPSTLPARAVAFGLQSAEKFNPIGC
jgi:hypothetical protein